MLNVVQFILERFSDQATTVVFKQCSSKLKFSSFISRDCETQVIAEIIIFRQLK